MTQAITPAETLALNPITDESNPQSLINLVSDPVRKAIKSIPEHLLGHDEHYWRKRDYGRKPDDRLTATDWKVRLSLWSEYNRSIMDSKPFRTGYIHSGICTYEFFKKRYLENPENLAFVITPPSDYLKSLEECLYQSTENLRQILMTSPVREDGSLDAKAAAVHLAIHEHLDARIHGGIVQRIKQESVNVNVDAKTVNPDALSVEDRKRRLEELRRLQESAARGLDKEVKDVVAEAAPHPGGS